MYNVKMNNLPRNTAFILSLGLTGLILVVHYNEDYLPWRRPRIHPNLRPSQSQSQGQGHEILHLLTKFAETSNYDYDRGSQILQNMDNPSITNLRNSLFQKWEESQEGSSATAFPSRYKKHTNNKVEDAIPSPLSRDTCPSKTLYSSSDLNVQEIYEKLNFSQTDVTVSSRTSDIDITRERRWTPENKLKVYLLLHSHNDAGWRKTFSEYYEEETRLILDLVLERLNKDPGFKFIWAEISFFSLWWSEISLEKREQVKKLVANKQLEFVTGAWVMPDEANSHYLSDIIQLFEGHQWLKQNLDYHPKNGWAIDPFGISPSHAHLLKRSGLENMVVTRSHYNLKNYLSEQKSLEYWWRQQWDSKGTEDMFCHNMPYGFYDVGRTCGPNKRLCLALWNGHDIHLHPKGSTYGSGFGQLEIVPTANNKVTVSNLTNSALALLDQLRRQSTLFRSNNLLFPLGGDFQYKKREEWDVNLQRYFQMFDYLKANEQYNFEVKNSTLSDYFAAVRAEVNGNISVPSLSGDFFSYADQYKEYWSGYFTSRPFHKAMERTLLAVVRGSQLAFTLMAAEIYGERGSLAQDQLFLDTLLQKLLSSRQTLGLFQHHDAITGTSQDKVVVDYAELMLKAYKDANFVMQESLAFLTRNGGSMNNEENSFQSFETRRPELEPIFDKSNYSELFSRRVIELNESFPQRTVVAFNSLAKRRTVLVQVSVTSPNVKVFDLKKNEIPCEILPIFQSDKQPVENKSSRRNLRISQSTFRLGFLIENMGPLEVKNFDLVYNPNFRAKKVKIRIYNEKLTGFNESLDNYGSFDVKSGSSIHLSGDNKIELNNRHIKLFFSKVGAPTAISLNGSKPLPFSIDFVEYTAYSGLYLFSPESSKDVERKSPAIITVESEFQNYLDVFVSGGIQQRINLYRYDDLESFAIEVKNRVDLREQLNIEVGMRLSTPIKSEALFYTDNNGLQMQKRRRLESLPTQGNFYPIPTAAYIQDSRLRMTLLSGQPNGGSSLNDGQLEVMLDRRLSSDDGEGVDQGCMDNLETLSTFRIMFEDMLDDRHCEEVQEKKGDPGDLTQNQNQNQNEDLDLDQKRIFTPLLSLAAHLQLHFLLHPVHLFYRSGESVHNGGGEKKADLDPSNRDNNVNQTGTTISSSLRSLKNYRISPSAEIPCDVQLLATIPLTQLNNKNNNHAHKSHTNKVKVNVNVNQTVTNTVGLLYHRLGIHPRINSANFLRHCSLAPEDLGKIMVTGVFGHLFDPSAVTPMTLSFTQERSQPEKPGEPVFRSEEPILLQQMEIYGFRAEFQKNRTKGAD